MPRLSASILNDERACKSIKPTGERAEFRIKGVRNLILRASPTGIKQWSYRYLSPATGRWRRITLGPFPTVSLNAAKTQAIMILASVNAGRDPLAAPPTSDMTFGELSDQYLTEHALRAAPASTKEIRRMLNSDILPYLRPLKLDAITKADVARVIERVAGRGSFESADHVLTTLRATYNWAIGTGRTDHDPTRGLQKRNHGRPRDRVLTDDEIRTVWQVLESMPTHDRALAPGLRDALKLQLLLGTRIGETVGAAKSAVDLEAKLWILPTTATKSKREHKLPLSDMALRVLKTAMERSPSSPWLFPSPVDGKPLRPKSASRALIRLRRRLGVADFGTHDLRRTMATRLADMGVSDDVVSRILNHAPSGVTRRHYNHSSRFDQMRVALDAWSEQLSQLVKGAAPQPYVVRSEDGLAMDKLVTR